MPDGLPTDRSAELKVNLVADDKPVRRPIYKLSTAELKLVKIKIDDLLERDLSVLELAPAAALFFLYRKRMVESICEFIIGPSIKLPFETIIRFLG
jgi:hypothetical protein